MHLPTGFKIDAVDDAVRVDMLCCRVHTRSLLGKPHTAATSTCGERVQGCKQLKVLPPCPLAPANAKAIDRRGAPKEHRDFALRFSAFALKCRAALQAQGLLRLVLAASETCAARLPSAWSLSAPARCRSECCQQSRVASQKPFDLFLVAKKEQRSGKAKSLSAALSIVRL